MPRPLFRPFECVVLAAAMCGFSCEAGLVTVEAESGVLGADWGVSNSVSPAYITITSNSSGNNPGSSNRVATHSVTFPAAGTYQLYARVRVGPNTFNDDSMFYGSGFGTKSPTNNADWILVNGLGSAGFSNRTDVVTGGGSLGSGVWKWINLSQFSGNVSFGVSADSLTQTFEIGGREDGLDMDKFAFGTVGTAFTVANLDSGTDPASSSLTNRFPGPEGMTLHRFNPLEGGLNVDGANPAAGLILSGGVLCGTTLNGGLQGAGTAFSVSLDGTNFNAFRSFTNPPDAGNPAGNLVSYGSSFFGSTLAGGSNDAGTVFLANTNGGGSVLRGFAAVAADNATNAGGASPNALLALSGNWLYGAATAGGVAANGTVFSLSTNGSIFTTLHDFSALDANAGTNSDGALPCGGIVLSGNTLFGTASSGGANGTGVIFSLGTNGSNFLTLHSFSSVDTLAATNRDGAFPLGGLLRWNDTLYGTALGGGTGGKGVVFAIGTNGLGFTVLHHFSVTDALTGTNVDGAAPCSELVLSAGVLYGTTSAGGAHGSGTVFSVSTNGGQFRTIYAFTAVNPDTGTNRDGAFPVAGVLPLGRFLYGTTFGGGPGGVGTVFSVAIPAQPAVITNIVAGQNGVILYFLGAPNSTNVLEAATCLTPPVAWQAIATNLADAVGAWQFADTNTTGSARFYRSYAP